VNCLEFRFDCGATWLNLLATRGRSFSAQPIERISTPTRLAEWLELSGLAPVEPPVQADVVRACRLRETLRPLAMAVVAGEPAPPAAVAELQAFLGARPEPVRLEAGALLQRAAPATATVALRRIAYQAADQLTGAEREALDICPEHDCRGVFANPGRRRRWCPAPACASRGRVRALRERRGGAC
jgi:predicted RNA-binding Zn ribbon-like protein